MRSVLYRFPDLAQFEQMIAGVGDTELELGMPSGEAIEDGEWVLAIFELGRGRRATSCAARAAVSPDGGRLLFEPRDWRRLADFAQTQALNPSAAARASSDPGPLRSSAPPAGGVSTPPPSPALVRDAALRRESGRPPGDPARVLVVDDDADSRAAVRVLLRDDAVTIDEAGSAEEALDMTFAANYDCIVLDLGLPGMSGLEFLEALSSHGNVPPVVVYSARDLSKEESLRIRQYTDSIVVKGVRSPERLLDEVSLFLHSIRGGHARAGGSHPLRPEADLDGRRVLLVDDDMRNLFALSKVLRARGLNVSMAQDGMKALKMLDEDSGIELVLMDIMMPVMDGYQTTREIRTRPRLATLPIIALTAKAMRGDREKCLEAGANDYLSKPIDVDRLMSMMSVWLPS